MNPDFVVERHPIYGFGQIRPTPTAEECAAYYAKEFYSSAYPGVQNSGLESQSADREYLDGHRADICDTLVSVFGRSLTGLTALDIGCGWGEMLRYLRTQGVIGTGFDPAPEAIEHCRAQGFDVLHAGIEDLRSMRSGPFDVVTLIHVLEHLRDPIGALKDLLDTALKPGGVLVVETPNDFNPLQETAVAVHNLRRWWVSPPAHLNYFSPKTLADVLTGVGYTVRHVEATFPMDLFLVMGENYVGNRESGRACHARRVAFELNLRRTGNTAALRALYRALSEAGMGRTVVAFAQKEAA